MKRRIFPIILMLLFLSCGTNEDKSADKSELSRIEVINDKDLEKIINERNGKTLFLNVWATWCVPCVEEFPAIVTINKNYKDKNVEVVAVSVDLPSEIESKVVPFLEKQRANFKVYVAEEKSSDEIINLLDPEWSGAVPVTIVFDKNGKEQKFLLGAHTYEEMSAVIDSVNTL